MLRSIPGSICGGSRPAAEKSVKKPIVGDFLESRHKKLQAVKLQRRYLGRLRDNADDDILTEIFFQGWRGKEKRI
jgi:hypothetical protein